MLDFFFLTVLFGFLVVFVPLMYSIMGNTKKDEFGIVENDDIAKTKTVIDQEELAKKPYICGECGTGMDIIDYVCPQCMSKEKLKVE
jgi:lipopolysaccharide biosynthesis regulator YciM